MTIDKEINKLRNRHAWSRFLARYIDISLFSMAIGILINFIDSEFVFQIVVLFLWVFFETLFLITLGKTPGKFLFNLSLKDEEGKKLQLLPAFRRSLTVFLFGFFAGVPAISQLTLLYSYLIFLKTGTTKWDSDGHFRMTYNKIGMIRKLIITTLMLASIALIIFSVTQQ